MLVRNFFTLQFIIYNFYFTGGEETIETLCNINDKKPLHRISDKFLSLSIDPAVLLAGLNLSDKSLLLAEHLSPAYIRIAGPSTKFVKYVDNEDKGEDGLSEDGNNVVVTPSMWFGINEWLKLANLTPVFGINDIETSGGVWNPKSTLPLLEISDKLNVSCYWMLGFDPSEKNEVQYKQDLSIFQHTLNSFPERKDSWKIVGSDISRISTNDTGSILDEVKDLIIAVMLEPNTTEDIFPEKELISKLMQPQNETKVKIWTTAPKPSQPVTFSSALSWAEQVGNAAKIGYDVVFRQPRLHEIFSDTPVYWFSLLHKKLMGSNVLEAKSLTHHAGSSVYAHCSRNQVGLEEKGTLTLMVVNRNLQSYKVKVKLMHIPTTKFTEVQSYILTSPSEDSTDVFLNGQPLTTDLLAEEDPLKPEKHVMKSKAYLSLKVPPMSVGFFVLPKTTIPVCAEEETIYNYHSKETTRDESISHSEETILSLQSRGSFNKNPTLKELKERMKKEMEVDEKFSKSNLKSKLEILKQRLQYDSTERQADFEETKYYPEKNKLQQKQRLDLTQKRDELKKIISEKNKPTAYKHQADIGVRSKYLDLTSKEIDIILKERARASAARQNAFLSNDELDFIVEAVRTKFLDPRYKRSNSLNENETADLLVELLKNENRINQNKIKRSVRKRRDVNTQLLNIRSKLEENRQRLEERKSDVVGNAQNLKRNIKDKMRKLKLKNHRFKRDINMDLLKLKTKGEKEKSEKETARTPPRNFFKNKEEKEATMRKPGQTSYELLYELEEDEESVEEDFAPKMEIFAELAVPDDSEEEDTDSYNPKVKPKKIGLFEKIIKIRPNNDVRKLKNKKNKHDPKEIDDPITFLTTSDEFNDIEEDLPCIHEYFGPVSKKSGETNLSKRRTLKKQKNGKEKLVDFPGHDSMEYLRRKRNQKGINKDDIKELGEVDYYIHRYGAPSRASVKDNKSWEELNSNKYNDGKQSAGDNKKNNILDHIAYSSEETKGNIKSFEDEEKVTQMNAKTPHPEEVHIALSEEKNLDLSNKPPHLTETDSKQTTKIEQVTYKKQIRRKRESEDNKNQEIKKLEGKEDTPSYKISLKQRLKDLQEAALKDKIKFEEDLGKSKLKLKLEHRQKEDNLEGDTQVQDDKTEDKRRELLEKLRSLKKKIVQKKEDSDKPLSSNAKLQLMKPEIEEGNMAKDMIIKGISKASQKLKARLAQIEESVGKVVSDNPNKNIDPDNAHNENNNNQSFPPKEVVKRSLFDQKCDLFGNYKPLTPELKLWKPSDILSLKRDVNFVSPLKLKPVNDFQMFKNIIIPNKYLNFRRRRSIRNNIKDLDNRIDSYMNEIEKDIDIRNEQDDYYKLTIPREDKNKKDNQSIFNEIKSENKDEAFIPGGTSISTTTLVIKKDNKDAMAAADTTTPVINRMSENIQKIPTKEEEIEIESFISSVAGFFSNVGETLRSYIKSITSEN